MVGEEFAEIIGNSHGVAKLLGSSSLGAKIHIPLQLWHHLSIKTAMAQFDNLNLSIGFSTKCQDGIAKASVSGKLSNSERSGPSSGCK